MVLLTQRAPAATLPKKPQRAQVTYDCWLQETQEGWQTLPLVQTGDGVADQANRAAVIALDP